MVDWHSPAVMAQCMNALIALMWLSMGVYGYDCCQYSVLDWSIIRGTRQRKWAHIPYVSSKLLLWSYLVSCAVMLLITTPIDCNNSMRAIEVQMGLVTVSCSTMLAIRATCVYTGTQRKLVTGILALLTLVVLAAWLVGAGDASASWVPKAGQLWQEGACSNLAIKKRYSLKYMITIVYDLTVMLVTINGIVRMDSSSRIGTVLIRQGVQYFVITFLANSLVAGLTLANLNAPMSLIAAIPSSVICVICATRLFANLSEEARPEASGVYLIPSSSSRLEKVARLFTKGRGDGKHFTSSGGESYMSGDINTHALSYGNLSVCSPQIGRKSFTSGLRENDIEAQRTRPSLSLSVQITEDQVVTKESMPVHLSGMLSS